MLKSCHFSRREGRVRKKDGVGLKTFEFLNTTMKIYAIVSEVSGRAGLAYTLPLGARTA